MLPSSGNLRQPSCGVEAAHVLELALHDFAIEDGGVEDEALEALDTDVRQLSGTVFAEEEQVTGPAIRQADGPAVVDLVGPPAELDAEILEGTPSKAVAVHLRAVTGQRSTRHVGHLQVLLTTPDHVCSRCHVPPT